MKQVKIIEGKVYLVKEVTPNKSLVPTVRTIAIDVEVAIAAITMRMDKCINGLIVATENDLVLESSSDRAIMYIDTQQSVRGFNIASYEAMEHVLNTFKDFQSQEAAYLPLETINNLFTAAQIGQLKKAMVDYFGKWTDTISALEELEIFKYVNEQ